MTILRQRLLRRALPAIAFLVSLPAFGTDGRDRSPASDVPAAGVLRASLPIQQNDGAPISLVFYDLLGSTGDPEADRALRRRMEALVPLAAGDVLNAGFVLAARDRIESLDGVSNATVSLYASQNPGEVVLVVGALLSTGEPVTEDPKIPPAKFPVLISTEDSILRMQLGGSHGVFADHNPWFASAATFTGQSPIASDPPGAGWTSWGESSLEYGLAGATRLGDARATAFAEVTGVASASVGNELFTSDTRIRNRVEKAYAGVAWLDRSKDRSVKLSFGRQNWQLYGGFLFSRFAAGSNAGPNPGLYLSPRTTYQRALLLDARSGKWRFEAFDIDPSELEGYDSGSRYVGGNLRYVDPKRWEFGLTGYRATESNANVALSGGGSVPREGMRVRALRLGWRDTFGVAGLDLLGEYAAQDSSRVDWNARAWYAQAGYGFRDLPWSPHLTYRRASFSGDDPATTRQEAFDAQLSSGLDEWVQGISFKKVVTNSNLDSHRVRLNLGSGPKLNYTIDYFRLEANRLGPGMQKHYGDELNAAVRWSITPRIFFLGVGGIAWPGDEIRRRTQGVARPWATLQGSIYWGL